MMHHFVDSIDLIFVLVRRRYSYLRSNTSFDCNSTSFKNSVHRAAGEGESRRRRRHAGAGQRGWRVGAGERRRKRQRAGRGGVGVGGGDGGLGRLCRAVGGGREWCARGSRARGCGSRREETARAETRRQRAAMRGPGSGRPWSAAVSPSAGGASGAPLCRQQWCGGGTRRPASPRANSVGRAVSGSAVWRQSAPLTGVGGKRRVKGRRGAAVPGDAGSDARLAKATVAGAGGASVREKGGGE